MSTTANRIPLIEARHAAKQFRALFHGSFDRWEFAGSVRRQRPDCGDVEHVIIPKMEPAKASTLFADEQELHNAVTLRARFLVNEGVLEKKEYGDDGRTRMGEKAMGLVYRGIAHELYCATPDNWGAILAIRTGPAEFSKQLVTDLRRYGYRMEDGALYHEGRVIPCPSEDVLFSAAGYSRVIPPEERE